MSHQTGITANEQLKKFFSSYLDLDVRAFKVSIENEELTLSHFEKVKGSWKEDFDDLVPPLVFPSQPAYILYRLDTKNETTGYDWLLISWSPDDSPVRQKMLFASTKATLKQEFGSGQIKEEYHVTSQEDVSLKGLERHRLSIKSPAPLTTREEELAELRKSETTGLTEISVDSRSQTLSGVAFPLLPDALSAIERLGRKEINYAQFSIDIAKEEIHLVTCKTIELSQLPHQVPDDTARYHLYNFKHTHEGDYMESIVFIYSMPGYSCSIKERMLYSSCKAPFIITIESTGLKIEKKIEIDSGKELTEEFLLDEIHPKKHLHRPKFDKPKGPPNRGAKRITKPQS
ncbi:unnamed protein product [Bemisia tabaci]|uniref:Twinfilin n=1 Tax=Bemisia tabaci TaxID=7038 RepID=A0A9P0AM66_BEMTA|nr:unnamed protein product [Bemisia tabaci]